MEKNKKRKKNKNRKSLAETINFGKIDLTKYFIFEKEQMHSYFPTYNNIIVSKTKNSNFKICTVCYNHSNYTCPKCLDKYCSNKCFQKHIESKCTKYKNSSHFFM